MKTNHFSQKFFGRRTVTQQLRIIFLITIMLPVLLIGAVIYPYSVSQISQSYKNLTESDTMRIRSILLDVTMELYKLSEVIADDPALQHILTTEYTDAKDAIKDCSQYGLFQESLSRNVSISAIQLYYQPDSLAGIEQTYFYPIDSSVRSMPWFDQAANYAGSFWRTENRIDSRGNSYWELNFYRHLAIPKTNSYAILVMTVSDNYIRNLIDSDTFEVFVTVNKDPVFYSTKRRLAGTYFPVDIDYSKPYYSYNGYQKINSHYSIVSLATLVPYSSEDKIYILSSDRDSVVHLAKVTLSFVLLLLLSTLIPALIIRLFSGYFSSRVQTLRLAMNKVSKNDYNLVDSISGDDELSATFSDLKTMAEKIKETEASIYKAQLKEQDIINHQQQIELKMLASQINPHFLYNTLETIRMKAFAEGNPDVANAIKLLGKSMRYVLSSTGTTATFLDKELDHILTYLSIQKLRFAERLNYDIQIRNIKPENYRILPLLLQPIVENAIVHGIAEKDEGGHLIVRIQKSTYEKKLVFQVYDNGVGLSKEELLLLRKQITLCPEDTEGSIGLYNINNRIQLYYGKNYGMVIHSKKNYGTLVTISLPLGSMEATTET